MKKACLRSCCLLLVLSVLMGLLPATLVYAGDPYTYEIREGEAYITSYNGIDEQVVIPETLGDAPVAGIGSFAFEEASLKELVLPHSLRFLGDGAFFACASLEKVTFGEGLTHIGEAAFADCVSLGEILLPKSLATMGSEVFSGCNALTSLAVEEGCEAFRSGGNCILETATGKLLAGCGASVIPDDGSVKSIAPYAFSCMQGLTSLEIPESVTAIGDGAFENTGLTMLFIPASVVTVGKHILHGTSLTALYCGGEAQPADWQEKWNAGVEVPPIWSYDNTCPHGDSRKEYLEPTCETEGFEKEVCNLCESELWLKLLPSAGHTEKTETVEPTCAKAGYTLVSCTLCGKELSRKVLPVSSQHGELRTERVEPTCEKDGYEKQICTVCGKTATTVKLPSPGHTEYTETVLPTCAQSGYTRVTCTVCGVEIVYAELPVSAKHGELRVESVPATCTEDGYEKQICTVCGKTVKEEIFSAFGHKEQTETSFPSCIQGGYTRVTCTVCGEELSYLEFPPSEDHVSPETERVEPTCAKAGYVKVTCTTCGMQISFEELPPLTEHMTPETERVEPTCGQGGYVKVTCTTCGMQVSFEELPPLTEHMTPETERVEPTCGQGGYVKVTCTTCGMEVSFEELPALTEHMTPETERVEPTCAKAGYVKVTCTTCGQQISHEDLPVTEEHPSLERETVLPTCTAEGYQRDVCTLCGRTASETIYPATGHTVEREAVSATCGKDGYVHETCAVCGEELSHTLLPATGHLYGETGVCTGCGIPAGDPIEDFTYTLMGAGVMITGYKGSNTRVVIPSHFKGAPVLRIGDNAFLSKPVETVVLPSTLVEIGKFAFEACTSLEEVVIPPSVRKIDQGAFAGCSALKVLYLGDGLEILESAAFAGCTSLTAVTLPAKLKTLAPGAFAHCTALTSLSVEAGNPVYKAEGNCILEKETGILLMGCVASRIPADGSVKAIAQSAFEGLTELTALHLPEGLVSIGAYAFRGTGLIALTIPGTVEAVGRYILFDTPAQRVYCSAETRPEGWHLNWIAGSEAEVFFGGPSCEHEETLLLSEKQPGCAAEGEQVYACASCGVETRRVSIPALGHVYSKGICKTCGCPEGLVLELIGGAYRVTGYTGTAEVLVLPEKLDGIPLIAVTSGAFAGNTHLKKIFLPEAVLLVGEGAFAGCTSLEEILCARDHATPIWHSHWAWGAEAAIAWGQVPPTASPILYGDLNLDGKINPMDYMLLKNHVLGRKLLTEEQRRGGDLNRDGKINARDYLLLKNHVLGKYTIDQTQ